MSIFGVNKGRITKDDTKVNLRMFISVCFPRCKLVLDSYKLNLNMKDANNNYFEESIELSLSSIMNLMMRIRSHHRQIIILIILSILVNHL